MEKETEAKFNVLEKTEKDMEKKIEKTKNETMNYDTNTAVENDKIIPPEKFDALFEQAR